MNYVYIELIRRQKSIVIASSQSKGVHPGRQSGFLQDASHACQRSKVINLFIGKGLYLWHVGMVTKAGKGVVRRGDRIVRESFKLSRLVPKEYKHWLYK